MKSIQCQIYEELVSRSQTLSSQGAYQLGRLSSLINKRPVTKGSGYARPRGGHSHKVCRTICDRDQNKINGSRVYFD